MCKTKHFATEAAALFDKLRGINVKNTNLSLFIDKDVLIRSAGHIGKCLYFNYNVNNLILLSKYHYFVKFCHEKMQHLGLATTLFGQGFGIPQARYTVKATIRDYLTC